MLHTQGFIHCDLKPENLFLDDAPSRACGSSTSGWCALRPCPPSPARPPPPASTPTRGPRSTWPPSSARAPPCWTRARTSTRSGCCCTRCSPGGRPSSAAHAQVLQSHLSLRPQRPSELVPVPPAVEAVVLQCLAKERFRRFDSAAAVRGALREALSQPARPRPRPVPRPPRVLPPPPSPHAPPQARRSVAVLLFSSTANPLSIQKVLSGLGGQVAWRDGPRFAGVFDPNAGENPVQRAMRAAQELEERELVTTALVDVATVTVQQRPGSAPRYLGSIFTRKERYPAATDTFPLLLTPAAADAVPDVRCVSVPEREGLLRPVPAEVAPRTEATVLKLGSEVLIGRDEELQDLLGERAHGGGRARPPRWPPCWASGATARATSAPSWPTGCARACPAPASTRCARASPCRETPPAPCARCCAWRSTPSSRTTRARRRRAAPPSSRGWGPSWPRSCGPACPPRWAGPPRTVRSCRAGPRRRAPCARWPCAPPVSCWPPSPASARCACCWMTRTSRTRLRWMRWSTRVWPRRRCRCGSACWPARSSSAAGPRGARAPPTASPSRWGRWRPSMRRRCAARCCARWRTCPPQAVERIVERARRVPLFLVELVRALKRQGLVRQRGAGGSWYLVTDELDTLPGAAAGGVAGGPRAGRAASGAGGARAAVRAAGLGLHRRLGRGRGARAGARGARRGLPAGSAATPRAGCWTWGCWWSTATRS